MYMRERVCACPFVRGARALASRLFFRLLLFTWSDFFNMKKAFCATSGLELISVERSKGLVVGKLRIPSAKPVSAVNSA